MPGSDPAQRGSPGGGTRQELAAPAFPGIAWWRSAWQEVITFLIRILTFAAAMMIIASFSFPWVRLDGADDFRSGIGLVTLALSPTVNYLYSVSPVQTLVLVGGPVLMLLAALIVAFQYGRRRRATVATLVVVGTAHALIFVPRDLLAGGITNPQVEVGLSLIVVLSFALLFHQLLIMLRTFLMRRQRWAGLHRTLSVITGSGFYRWRET